MVNMSAKFDVEAHNGLVAIMFTSSFPYIIFVNCDLDLWPPKSTLINRVHPLTMVNVCQVWSRSIQRFSCYRVHKFISIYHICQLWPWPLTSKINRFHLLTMVNMSAKFDKEIHNSLVSIEFTSLFPYMSIVTLTFDLWPTKSIGLILLPWLTCLPSLIKKHTMV